MATKKAAPKNAKLHAWVDSIKKLCTPDKVVWCDGSKLGFYGFNYVWGPDVEPITELPLNDETVGIATVNTAKQQDVYYNLQGVRVAQPTKGLYIINGKKVVVK